MAPTSLKTTPQNGTENARLSPRQRMFISAFSVALCVCKASDVSGVPRRNHYRWMEQSERYRAAFLVARQDAIESVEAEVRRRAVEGVKRRLFCNGHPVIDPETGEQAVEIQYSDRLLLEFLKRHSPAWRGDIKLSGNVAVEHSGQTAVTLKGESTAGIQDDPDYREFLRLKSVEPER